MKWCAILLTAVLCQVQNTFTQTADMPYIQVASFSDKDDDGIKNKDDQCPTEAEDIDNFKDNDGCPDLDNDGDGLSDLQDKCSNVAEDLDGFEDSDGCPDPDNDRDGIPDIRDKCPNVAEDFDGFQDSDGCPDFDNDADGIADSTDKCPNIPEDRDTFEDFDGCPDPDNDKDGLLDTRDKCPDQAENINAFMDEDGCPDEAAPQIPMGKMLVQEIRFEGRSGELNTISYAILDSLAKSLAAYPEINLEVIAHTDKSSDPDADYTLGQQMAQAVCTYWASKGISENRLTATSMGSSKPTASNVTPQGREDNRRIEIDRTK